MSENWVPRSVVTILPKFQILIALLDTFPTAQTRTKDVGHNNARSHVHSVPFKPRCFVLVRVAVVALYL